MNKHALIMVIYCLAPIIILAVLWASGVSSTILTIAVLALCPIMHVAMMFGMKKQGNNNDKYGTSLTSNV